MTLLNKPITLEHLKIFKTLTIDAKQDMLDARPGWTYRGPIMNGSIYLDFDQWESNKFIRNSIPKKIYSNPDNYGFKQKRISPLSKELDFIKDGDVANLDNWKYCYKFDNHRSSLFNGSSFKRYRLDVPHHALFISNNSEWLLEESKKNLEKASYEVLKLNASISKDNSKLITMQVEEDTFYTGSGTTMCLAALDLYGKTHNAQYDMRRPSFSIFSKAKNVEISSLVLGEPTIEISNEAYIQSIIKDNDLHHYKNFISQKNLEYVENRISEGSHKYTYYGEFYFVEGTYHLVQNNR